MEEKISFFWDNIDHFWDRQWELSEKAIKTPAM